MKRKAYRCNSDTICTRLRALRHDNYQQSDERGCQEEQPYQNASPLHEKRSSSATATTASGNSCCEVI